MILSSKRIIAYLLAALVAAGAAFSFTGCSSPDASSPSGGAQSGQASDQIVNVTMSVDASAAGGEASEDVAVQVASGSTVFDVLEASGISYNAADSSYGPYVTSINGLAEREHGSSSGWMFTINGDYADSGMSSATVSDGDAVVWVYFVGDEAPASDAS